MTARCALYMSASHVFSLHRVGLESSSTASSPADLYSPPNFTMFPCEYVDGFWVRRAKVLI